MSIIFPLALPTITGIKNITMKPLSIVAMSQSPFTYAQQVQRGQGQMWSADVTLPTMKRIKAEVWRSFFLALNGIEGTFTMGDPDAIKPQGIATGDPLIDGAGQKGQIINTKGWTPSITGILKAGDYLQINEDNLPRLYKVLKDTNSDADGKVSLELFPRIRKATIDETSIIVNNPVGLWRLSEMPNSESDENGFFNMSFSCIEAISI